MSNKVINTVCMDCLGNIMRYHAITSLRGLCLLQPHSVLCEVESAVICRVLASFLTILQTRGVLACVVCFVLLLGKSKPLYYYVCQLFLIRVCASVPKAVLCCSNVRADRKAPAKTTHRSWKLLVSFESLSSLTPPPNIPSSPGWIPAGVTRACMLHARVLVMCMQRHYSIKSLRGLGDDIRRHADMRPDKHYAPHSH